MNLKKILLTVLLVFLNSLRSVGQAIVPGSDVDVRSPDQNTLMHFALKTDASGFKTLNYSVSYKKKSVILDSEIDLKIDNNLSESAMALKVDHHKTWFENLKITGIKYTSKDTTWYPLYGENKHIRDHFDSAVISFVKDDNPIYKLDLEIRAYDEGVAFRFHFPENEKGTYYRITAENTSFTLPENTMAWVAHWAQAPYQKLPLKNWDRESERPLTLELGNGLFACLAEAQMVDYARTKFKLSPEKPNTVQTSMYTAADLISPFNTPWRVVMVAEKPEQLAENNYLLLNLNEPNQILDPSWIKPGKQMRVMAQTTADAMKNIDFAVDHHLQYVLFDWKWYGPAFSFSSDASKVAIPNLDMPGVIRYGKERGVGVWLYINQQAALMQSDSLFRIYHQWGVKGVKIGFVQVGSHRWTTWIEKVIRQAAASQIMLDIHDDWRPTGEQRTWPNLLSAEGIRGNEEFPDATHNTVLPFTRFIAGAADYTICYFDKRIKTTHAHQLALAAVYYSPLQTLYWYDKPDAYHGEPELEFWDHIQTSWDETKVLNGKPGEFVTVARRSGKEWFIGCITNDSARVLPIKLDFLDKNKTYTMTSYTDDPNVTTSTHVKVTRGKANAKTLIRMTLKASGGMAIWLKSGE